MPQLYLSFRRLYPLLGSFLLLVLTLPAAAQTYLLPTSGTTAFTTCGGTLYDDGGANGVYSANANGSVTLTPATAGNKIRLQFTSFSVETGYDRLYIYDGSTTSAPLIGTYDSQSPGTVYATTSAGTLTVRFTSDYVGQYNGFAADIACVTTIPQADLAIQGASAQPLAIVPGNSLSVNCTVYNLAGTTAQSSSVGYYLSADATLSANDVLLGNSVGGPLGVNQSSYRSATLPVPTSTPTGSYYLIFAADYLNVVAESNETNNTASISVNVVPPTVDLVVQQANVSTPNTAPGNVLSLTCYILNQGNATAAFSSVGYYLSTDAALDANDQLLTSSFGGQLTPNFSQYRSVSTNVPPGTAPGSYYILFAADYQGVVSESNETNNVAAVSITVSAPSVDLVVSQAQLSQSSVAAGATLNATAYVYNQGNTTAGTSSAGVYLSTDAALDANDQLLTASTVPQLTTNQGYTIYPQLTLPGTLAPGSYYVLFAADHLNAVTETNETNNVRSLALTVLAPSVDLVMQQVYLSPTTTVPGNTISVNSTIYNQGNSSASSSNVGYYLSTDNVLSANDVLVGNSPGGTLTGGNYATRSGSLTVPAGTATGFYYVFFVADYQNLVTETNENNNAASTTLTIVAPGIDLALTQQGLSRTSAGASIPFSAYVTIYNQGTSGASSSNVGYYLSADNVLSANDVLLGASTGGFLAANDYGSRGANLNIPVATTPGSYYVLFVADHTGIVSETNENNNLVALPFFVTAPFNGTVVPFSGTATITTCGTTVYDHGGTDDYADNANGTLVINPGTAGSKIQLVFSSFSVEGCCDRLIIYDGPGISSPVIGSYINSPGTITATNGTGTLTLQFITDGSVTYSGFQATVACVTGGSNSLPDLLPVLTSNNPTTAAPGSTISLLTTIVNQGTAVASSSTIGYYLSVNTTLDASDTALGASVGSALSPNQASGRGGLFTIPATMPAGNYFLLHVADPQNSVSESNEANNIVFTNLLLSSGPLPDLVISQATLSSYSVVRGGVTNASCVLINQGNSAAAQSATGYYLSTDAVFSGNDVFLGNSQAGVLGSGSAQAMAASLIIPSTTAAGSYYMLFVADHVNSLAESNETNNVAVRSFAVTIVQGTRDEQLAGLTLSVFPNPAAVGQQFAVQLTGPGNGKTADLNLYDALGRQVAHQQLTLNGQRTPATFDTKALSPGVYVLRLTGAGLNATRRIVIE